MRQTVQQSYVEERRVASFSQSLNHMMQTDLHTDGHVLILGPSMSSTLVMVVAMFGMLTLYILVMVLFSLF